jgi:hypothetical protein
MASLLTPSLLCTRPHEYLSVINHLKGVLAGKELPRHFVDSLIDNLAWPDADTIGAEIEYVHTVEFFIEKILPKDYDGKAAEKLILEHSAKYAAYQSAKIIRDTELKTYTNLKAAIENKGITYCGIILDHCDAQLRMELEQHPEWLTYDQSSLRSNPVALWTEVQRITHRSPQGLPSSVTLFNALTKDVPLGTTMMSLLANHRILFVRYTMLGYDLSADMIVFTTS